MEKYIFPYIDHKNIIRSFKYICVIIVVLFGLASIVATGGGGDGDKDNSSSGNTPPIASITSPSNNLTFTQGITINFSGTGNDNEDGSLSGEALIWTSNIDGQIGTGTSFSKSDFSLGTHTITLTVSDSNQETGTNSIIIKIDPNNNPSAEILIPKPGRRYSQYDVIACYGNASDIEDGNLPYLSMRWDDNIEGSIGVGFTGGVGSNTPGIHNITFTATDSLGSTGQDSVSVSVEFFPYDTKSVYVSNNYAYISAAYDKLCIVDVGDPHDPSILSTTNIPAHLIGNAIIDDHLFAVSSSTTTRDGLHYYIYEFKVIDVSDPYSPAVVESLVFEFQSDFLVIHDMFISNSYAYLSGSTLIIIDISDPTNPFTVNQTEEFGGGNSIYVDGEYAYLYPGGIVDIGDPYNPSFVASFPYLTGGVNDIYVAGDYVYTSWFHVIDISDRANPTVGSSIRMDEKFAGKAVHVHGTNAYVIGLNGRMMVVDLINPDGLNIIGSVDISGLPTDIYISGDYAYVCADLGGLKIVDISNPRKPEIVSSIGGFGRILDFSLQGDHMYAAAESLGIQILNISDPLYVENDGFKNTSRWATDIFATNSTLYVTDQVGLKISDISDPVKPIKIGSILSDENYPVGVNVSESYAYMFTTYNFEVIDVNEPSNPISVGSLNENFICSAGGFRSTLSGSYVFAPSCTIHYYNPDRDLNCPIIDISDPSNPTIIGALGLINDVETVGSYAYVVSSSTERGFEILDISNPANPVTIGSIPSLEAYDIDLSGQYAYVMNGNALISVNINDPQNPYIADCLLFDGDNEDSGGINTNSNFSKLNIKGNYVYIAWRLIYVVDISDPNNLVLIDVLPPY